MKGGFFDIKYLSNDYLNLLCTSLKKNGYTYHFRNVLFNSKSWADAKNIYKEVSVPVKLVYGDKDWSNQNNRNSTKKLLGLESFSVIKNCGHFSFLEKPMEVTEIINN